MGAGEGSGVGAGEADADGVGLGLGAGVGGALGAAVGAAVGGGVGGGVGTGVGGAVGAVGTGVGGAPWTVIVPVIVGWIEQWYAYVPALANGTVLLAPAPIGPVSNAPVSDVAVWANPSAFCQVMRSPGAMLVFTGTNVKFRMTTVWLTPSAAPGSIATIARTRTVRRTRLLRRLR